MFKTKELRHCAYYGYSKWPGGIYATPSLSGSRQSASIAGAWYSMLHHGKKGYADLAKHLLDGIKRIKQEISKMPELELMHDS